MRWCTFHTSCNIACCIPILCDDMSSTFNNLIGSDLFAAELLLREALNNSVLYGSGVNYAWTIECEILLSTSLLTIHCKDSGDVFDWRATLMSKVEIDAVSGRGHAIFRAYANRISYNDKCNKLTLVRKLVRMATFFWQAEGTHKLSWWKQWYRYFGICSIADCAHHKLSCAERQN